MTSGPAIQSVFAITNFAGNIAMSSTNSVHRSFVYRPRAYYDRPFWAGCTTSKQQISQSLANSVQQALLPVTGKDLYVDTIELLARPHLSDGDLRKLRRMNWPGHVKAWQWRRHPRYQILRIHQPRNVTAAALHPVFQWYQVRRVDVALDLNVASEGASEVLKDFLAHNLRQKWHGRRMMSQFMDTYYFSAAWRGRNIAIYRARHAKMSGGPAAHLELRFYGSSSCQALGIAQLPDLFTWDAAATILNNCCFSAVIPRLVGKRVRVIANSTWLGRHRTGFSHAGTTASAEGEVILLLSRLLELPPGQMAVATAQRWCEIPWWRPGEVMADHPVAALVKGLRTPKLF